jgi:uncharacterized membrane protein
MPRKFFLLIITLVFFATTPVAKAATMSLSPSTGTFSVGSTFDVSIFLDTDSKSVNAIAVSLLYPPDMLQVVSPSLGQSVIGVWTAAPKFDNLAGRVDLQGGIPGGITASKALISTVTFRVKSVGQAIVKFLDNSKVLLNNGLGTNVLSQASSAIYNLRLPPPAGPIIASETNPDETAWYNARTVSFRFASNGQDVEGYSYTLSDDPTTFPDNINRGLKSSVTYTDVPDGIRFFHVKSLRDGVWGGVSRYSVKIDSTPPAEFNVDIVPSSHTSTTKPVIQFSTTDSFSGVEHYEMKIVPLSVNRPDMLFSETVSPYIAPSLEKGSYDVIVRAYDNAHNYREVTERLVITNRFMSFVGSTGLRFGDTVLSWFWVILILLVLVGGGVFMLFRARNFHVNIHLAHKEKRLPDNVVEQLEELKKYRSKYGAKALVVIFALGFIFSGQESMAQSSPISTPVITTISKDISNREIFYVGGKTDKGNVTVVLYMQNLESGATLTETTESDSDGNWFYRSSNFLSAARYRLWVQGRIDEELSPPGPQSNITITRTAIQFGANRLSYEAIYLSIIIVMVLGIITLIVLIILHYYHGRKKHRLFLAHVQSTEESIRRGFAVLRRDIEDEINDTRKNLLSDPHSKEHKEREERLLSDLTAIQKHVGEEVWDLKMNPDDD